MIYFSILFGLAIMFAPVVLSWLRNDESLISFTFITFPAGMCFMVLGLMLSRQNNDSRTLGIKINPIVLVVLLFILFMVIGLKNKGLL